MCRLKLYSRHPRKCVAPIDNLLNTREVCREELEGHLPYLKFSDVIFVSVVNLWIFIPLQSLR